MKINKLKHYKASYQRETTRYRNVDPELIERIVNQEVSKYREAWSQEKDSILASYSEEIKKREKHISIVTESVHHYKIENKNLMDIIYAKDTEIQKLHNQLQDSLKSL